MSTSYVTTVNINIKTSLQRIINRTFLLPANAPYTLFSTILFFLLNAYLVWEANVLQFDCLANCSSQFESFIFHIATTSACVLLLFLSVSKDLMEENHRFNETLSLGKIINAVLSWCLLSIMFIPTMELYGNGPAKAFIARHHISVLDFIPKKSH